MSLPASGGRLAFWRAVGYVLDESGLLQGRVGSGSDLRGVWEEGNWRPRGDRVCARACVCVCARARACRLPMGAGTPGAS